MEQVLLFQVGDRPYALEVINIQEVIESPRLFYIPQAPACFSGAINFHGSIVPVLDLAAYLGLDADRQRDRRLLVLPHHLCPLGLSVSAVRRIISRDPEAGEPYRETGSEDHFIRFRFEWEGELIHMLDVSRLVASLEKVDGGRNQWVCGS